MGRVGLDSFDLVVVVDRNWNFGCWLSAVSASRTGLLSEETRGSPRKVSRTLGGERSYKDGKK